MFNNIGEKIKGIAIATFIIELIAFIFGGIAVIVIGAEQSRSQIGLFILLGILVMGVGIVVAFLSVMMLFAYGQITSNTDKLVEIGKMQTKILLNQTDIMADVKNDDGEDKSVFATPEAMEVINMTETSKEISDLDVYMIARREEAEQNGEVEIEPIEDEDDDDEDDE